MPEAIRLITTVPDAVVGRMIGQHPTARDYNRVIGEWDTDVYRPDGSLLLAYRVGRLLSVDLRRARLPLEKMAKTTGHRKHAQGSNETLYNNAAGFLQGRQLAFAGDHPREWRDLQPLLWSLDAVFREECPDRYAIVERAASETRPELLIPRTVFTTVTANLCSTGIHTDGKNLEGGLGMMAAIHSTDFAGGLFVLPKFRVAVRLRPGDVLCVDNREYHGNTPFLCGWRVSLIAYYHESNRSR